MRTPICVLGLVLAGTLDSAAIAQTNPLWRYESRDSIAFFRVTPLGSLLVATNVSLNDQIPTRIRIEVLEELRQRHDGENAPAHLTGVDPLAAVAAEPIAERSACTGEQSVVTFEG